MNTSGQTAEVTATPATTIAPSTAAGVSPVKLPLAVRKSVRDDWETKRPEFEAEISNLLDVQWTIPIDYATLYPFAEQVIAKENPGVMISEYIASTVENLQRYVEDYGDDGKAELNKVAYAHTVLIAPTSDSKVNYSGCDIVDGNLRNVFAQSSLGTNVLDATSDIAGAVNVAGAIGNTSALDFIARSNIRLVWDAKADELQSKFSDMLGCPVFSLTPNFERNATILQKFEKRHKKVADPSLREDWLSRIGEWTLGYFEGVKDTLVYKGFDTDTMLQEGFRDSVEKNEIELRVVEKLVKGSYNEIIIENGVLVIQTLPETWTSNIGDAAEDILMVL